MSQFIALSAWALPQSDSGAYRRTVMIRIADIVSVYPGRADFTADNVSVIEMTRPVSSLFSEYCAENEFKIYASDSVLSIELKIKEAQAGGKLCQC